MSSLSGSLFIPKSKDRIASRAYREYIHAQCCLACGDFPSDPAHTISRKWATGSDLTCIPLCRQCHRAYDDAGRHRDEWLLAHKINLPVAFMMLEIGFRRKHGLPLSGELALDMRDAGLIEPPFTRRKNR